MRSELSRIALFLLVKNVAKRSARDLSDELGGNLVSGTLCNVFLRSFHSFLIYSQSLYFRPISYFWPITLFVNGRDIIQTNFQQAENTVNHHTLWFNIVVRVADERRYTMQCANVSVANIRRNQCNIQYLYMAIK